MTPPVPRRGSAPPATAVAGAVLAIILAGCSSGPAGTGSTGAPDKGFVGGDGTVTLVASGDRRAAVSFHGTTLQGKRFDVADQRGTVVVVNVWGSWCSPCIKEAPALQSAWEQTRSRGAVFVGVNTRDGKASALAHEKRFGVTYPSIGDDGGRVLLAFRGAVGAAAIPSTLVLDRRGQVAARVLGPVSATTLRSIVDDVLTEPSAKAHA